MTEQTIIGSPCPYMVYSDTGYHTCEIFNAERKAKNPHEDIGVCCAWFYDLGNPTMTFTVTPGRIPQEKPNIQWEPPERPSMTENDVPNICPLKYSWKEIDSRIFLLNEKFFHSKKHIREMKEFEKWVKDLPKEKVGHRP
jgi:hypothetical protein